MTRGRVRQDKRTEGARKENFHQDKMSCFTFYNLGGPSRLNRGSKGLNYWVWTG